MVIIIFYSHIVPYKWWRIEGEAYRPNEEPAVPKFLLSSLYNAMFYSAVVLFFLLKNAHPQGRRIMGRESRRNVFILLYDLKRSFCKKIQSLTFTDAAVFIQIVSKPGLPALPSHWTTRRHRHRLRRMHTHRHTHTHAHTHSHARTQTHRQVPSGV